MDASSIGSQKSLLSAVAFTKANTNLLIIEPCVGQYFSFELIEPQLFTKNLKTM